MCQLDDLSDDLTVTTDNNGDSEQVVSEEPSPLDKLTRYSSSDEICKSVERFVDEAKRLDEVKRGIAKHELLKKLKSIKFQGAGDFVRGLFKETRNHGTDSSKDILFDDPEPWPGPVCGRELLHELSGAIKKYVILPDGGYTALSLWIAFSWVHDAFDTSPIADFSSPTKRCGKSTGLRVLSRLVPKPLMAANISTAALFRSIEHFSPTLMIDEADTFLKFNEELNGVLNAGHERDGAFVLRVEGDDHQPKRFCVWGPKVISGIGKRKDTLEDRSIRILMRRKGAGEKVEKLRRKNLEIFSVLKQKAARWAADNFETARTWEPSLPEALNDRAADNWGPLLTIAEMAGGQWPGLAMEAALLISGSQDDDEDAIGVMLLADISDYFEETETDRVTSEDVEKHMVQLEDRPWPEYRKGKPISKTGIARLLKPFGIKAKVIRIGGRTPRGYEKTDFDDAFSRYLPDRGFPSATGATQLKNKELERNQSATHDRDVALENRDKPFKNSHVAGVALENRVPGEKIKKNAEFDEVRL